MKKITIAMALPLLFSTSVALADNDYYIAANASQIDYEEFGDKNGYNVAIGKYIGNRASVELGYADFGTISESEGGVSVEAESSAIQLSGVGYIPLGTKGGVFGRVGVEKVKVDLEGRLQGLVARESEDVTDVYYGIGGYYNITNNLDFRLEYQQHNAIDTDTVNAGITFSTF